MLSSVDDTTEFTIAVLPDTQFYTEKDNGIFEQQCQWIADNASTYNIQNFLHVGDLVENQNQSATEWDIAEDAVSRVTGQNIPPLLGTGNHDQPSDRTLTEFRSRFSTTWYGNQLDGHSNILDWGTYDGNPENLWFTQSLLGEEWVFVVCEYFARDTVVQWVIDTFDTHSDKHGMFLTHGFLEETGARGTDTNYVSGDANSAEQMWNAGVDDLTNVNFEIGGHYHDPDIYNARRTDTAGGSDLSQLHTNYQAADGGNGAGTGGNGWLRLLVIDIADRLLHSYAYSPYLDQWDESDSTEFTINISGTTGSTVRLPQRAGIARYTNGHWVRAGVAQRRGDGYIRGDASSLTRNNN